MLSMLLITVNDIKILITVNFVASLLKYQKCYLKSDLLNKTNI